MAASASDLQSKPLKPGERVVVTRDIPGVPEGMAGRVKTTQGLTWLRYWVEFANGRWVGSVSQAHLVRQRDWEEFKRRREEDRLKPEVAQAPAAEAGEAGGGDEAAATGGAGGRVPAHLLERSRRARERLAAG